MQAGDHYSDFKLVQSARNATFITEALPFNYSTRGGGAKVPYSYCIQSEICLRKLNIHAGGDDWL
jgi:outer membrane phospholipase A